MSDENEFEGKLKFQVDPLKALLRSQIKSFLSGERTLNDICMENKQNGNGLPISAKTMRKRILDLAQEDGEIRKMLMEKEGKINRGYDYTEVIINMLKHDLSQREVADRYKVSRDTLKDAIDKFKQAQPEKVKYLIEKHARIHKAGRNCEPVAWSSEERIILDELEEEYKKKMEEGPRTTNTTNQKNKE